METRELASGPSYRPVIRAPWHGRLGGRILSFTGGTPVPVRLRSEVRDYGMQGSMEMLKSWGFSHIKAAEKMFNT